MLRIVPGETDGGGTVLRLEGQLIGPWVDELRRACEALLVRGAVTLDLAGVSFVEQRGVQLLRTLARGGIPLRHCSPFVTEQLKVRV